MRLFASIDLSDAARAAIAAEQAAVVSSLGEGARGLKVVRPEHMHLTLVFVGDATDAVGAAIVDRMQVDIDQAPFELAFGGVGTFPPRGAPRILWLGVLAGADSAITLHASVASRFEAAGAHVDRRPLQPHLTLARWRHAAGSVLVRAKDRTRRVATVEVAGVTLYQSRLSSSGPTYVRLAHSRLICPPSP
jgi:RNA 2',3'-cyclic 3'-phosphodiesterase